MVLLNGPVQNALFCFKGRYRNVHGKELPVSKGWNSLLPTWEPQVPLQGTAGSHRLEVMAPNLGTMGYHCKQLPVLRGWNSCFPTWEPQVTIAKNFRFLKVGTDGSQRGNQRLPWQGTAGSHRLEVMVPNLGTMGYHCKQLPVPRGWNSCFPTWEP